MSINPCVSKNTEWKFFCKFDSMLLGGCYTHDTAYNNNNNNTKSFSSYIRHVAAVLVLVLVLDMVPS